MIALLSFSQSQKEWDTKFYFLLFLYFPLSTLENMVGICTNLKQTAAHSSINRYNFLPFFWFPV